MHRSDQRELSTNPRDLRLATFTIPADVTLDAPLRELELRAALGATADELLFPHPAHLIGMLPGPRHGADLFDRRAGSGAQEILLHSLFVLHPLFDGDADRVRHRHDLV